MIELPVCPCCGYDLAVDKPVMINDFSMIGAGYPLVYKGTPVRLTGAQALVCWALMKAYPRHLTISALLERVTIDKENDNLISVHVSRVRKKLRAIGAPNPIRTMSRAYIWEPRGVGDETADATAKPTRASYAWPASNRP